VFRRPATKVATGLAWLYAKPVIDPNPSSGGATPEAAASRSYDGLSRRSSASYVKVWLSSGGDAVGGAERFPSIYSGRKRPELSLGRACR
jgi:hypothetical protein